MFVFIGEKTNVFKLGKMFVWLLCSYVLPPLRPSYLLPPLLISPNQDFIDLWIGTD